MNLTLENNIRGGITSVRGDTYVKSDDNKTMLYLDATSLYGHSMRQLPPYDETELWYAHTVLYKKKLEEEVSTSEDSDFGYFLEVDSRYRDNIKNKTKAFPFCPEKKKFS